MDEFQTFTKSKHQKKQSDHKENLDINMRKREIIKTP